MRMMFKASTEYHDVEINNDYDYFIVPYTDDVLTTDGWKSVKVLQEGDFICNDEESVMIQYIQIKDGKYYLYV